MKARTKLLLVPVVALLTGSCLAESSGASLFVVGAISPEDCVADPGNNFLLRGVLDVGPNAAFATAYEGALEAHTNLGSTFRNQTLTEREDESPNYRGNFGPSNANIVVIEQAQVSFTSAAGQPLPDSDIGGAPFTFPAVGNERLTRVGAVVFNQNNSVDNAIAVPVSLISLEEAQALNALVPPEGLELFVTVTLQGTTSGGGTVVAPEFTFPILVCKQCLIGEGAGFDGVNFTCADGTAPVPPADPEQICDRGQDVLIDTCLQ